MIMLIVGLLLLTWAVLPSLVFELKPKLVEGAPSDQTRSLGEWLSRGLDNTAIITRTLWFAIVPLPLSFLAFHWLVLHRILPDSLIKAVDFGSRLTLPLIRQDGLVLAVSGATLFGFILKYLTTVLDTILDVDNYLRHLPKKALPAHSSPNAAPRCCATSPPIVTIKTAAHTRRSLSLPTAWVQWSRLICCAISSALRTTAGTEAWPDTNSDKTVETGESKASHLRLLDEGPLPQLVYCFSPAIRIVDRLPISRTTRSPLSPPQSILPCPRSVPPSPDENDSIRT